MLFKVYYFVFLSLTYYKFTSSAVTLEVNAGTGKHPINPDIYGMSFADRDFGKEIKLSFNRWGGNEMTRYNWKLDISNSGNDWFFENIPKENNNTAALPDGSLADRFVEADQAIGARSMITLPLIGWTPKDRVKSCSFSVKKYGEQQKTDQWMPDCGNGIDKDGKKITGNDPLDTSVAVNVSFAKEWVQHLVKKFGDSTKKGVLYYEMDNEYDLWNETHRDVRTNPVGTDEIIKLTEEYATAVKEVDPSALVLGLVGWGYLSLLKSGLDQRNNSASDRKTHDDVTFAEYYLRTLKAYETKSKKRLIDYLDCHFYPQQSNVFTETNDTKTNLLRLHSTKGLWDPTYVDESWIHDMGSDVDKVNFIPRMKKYIADNYPGTKIAITEYNFGAMKSITGALTQADVLGIFGREGVDLAALWNPEQYGGPGKNEPWAYAFRMFRNYDGKGSQFGDTSVTAKSSDSDTLDIFASTRSSDKALIIIVINKDPLTEISTNVTITGFNSTAKAKLFTYSAADLTKIIAKPDVTVTNNTIAGKFAPYSINLFALTP